MKIWLRKHWKMSVIVIVFGVLWFFVGSVLGPGNGLLLASNAAAALAFGLYFFSLWKWGLVVVPLATVLVAFGVLDFGAEKVQISNIKILGWIPPIPDFKAPLFSVDLGTETEEETSGEDLPPRAAKANQERQDLAKISEAEIKLAYQRAISTGSVEVKLKESAPRLIVVLRSLVDQDGNEVIGPNGKQVMRPEWTKEDEPWDFSRGFLATPDLAIKDGLLSDSLMPISQLLPDGSGWVKAWTWTSLVIWPDPDQEDKETDDTGKVLLAAATSIVSGRQHPKQDEVLAVVDGWTSSEVVVAKDEVFEFGPVPHEEDIKRLRVRSGAGGFAPLLPIEVDDGWVARVHFNSINPLEELMRVRVVEGEPISVAIRKLM